MNILLFAFGAVVVVDRIEGPYAVLEWRDASVTEVPLSELPGGLSEGDHLVLGARRLASATALFRASSAASSPRVSR